MAMLNKIILMGRLTRDPEMRRTASGTAVTSFTLACDRDYKSDDGKRETDFIDCVAWRNEAEFVSKYFTKGRMAIVEGRLQLRDWTARDGGTRRSAEVLVANTYFGDSKRSESDTPSADQQARNRENLANKMAEQLGGQSDFKEIGDEDGELPF